MENNNPQGQPLPPANHLAAAIVSTGFCFPFGIPAILNATKVNRLWYAGQQTESLNAAAAARKWMITAFVVGGICLILYLILCFALGIGIVLAETELFDTIY